MLFPNPQNKSVLALVLVTGQTIIGECVRNESQVEVHRARSFAATREGMALVPVFPFDENAVLTIQNSGVVMISEAVEPSIVTAYRSAVSGIALPASGNSAKIEMLRS